MTTLKLFEDKAPQRIEMPDAEVWYFESVALGAPPEDILDQLIQTIPWEQRTIALFGRQHLQPRLVAWYGDPGCSYTYSKTRFDPLPWTLLLAELKALVEGLVDLPFNSALLNLYRNHRDSMGFHSDNEPELGPTPAIASLSLGAERVFTLKHRRKAAKPVRLKLASGSLLLMQGDTQKYWVHGIAKQVAPCGPRVNLTFRQILG